MMMNELRPAFPPALLQMAGVAGGNAGRIGGMRAWSGGYMLPVHMPLFMSIF